MTGVLGSVPNVMWHGNVSLNTCEPAEPAVGSFHCVYRRVGCVAAPSARQQFVGPSFRLCAVPAPEAGVALGAAAATMVRVSQFVGWALLFASYATFYLCRKNYAFWLRSMMTE